MRVVVPLPAQRVQVSHFQVRAAVTVAPGMALAVDPGHLHAGRQRAGAIQVGVIAHVQHLVRVHAGGAGGGFKNPHIGFGNARLTGTHRGVKMLAYAHTVHIGIAVGQSHHWQARGEAYLAANRFTVADLCVASVAAWARPAAGLLAAYPLTQAWLQSCLDRPAQKQSRAMGA